MVRLVIWDAIAPIMTTLIFIIRYIPGTMPKTKTFLGFLQTGLQKFQWSFNDILRAKFQICMMIILNIRNYKHKQYNKLYKSRSQSL